jgi:hypothetical protein
MILIRQTQYPNVPVHEKIRFILSETILSSSINLVSSVPVRITGISGASNTQEAVLKFNVYNSAELMESLKIIHWCNMASAYDLEEGGNINDFRNLHFHKPGSCVHSSGLQAKNSTYHRLDY